MNGAKAKILIFCLSLLFGGLCLGLCFLDSGPFYPAKIAGTVIFTVWGFSAIPAYIAAVAWMCARAEGLYSRFGFFAYSLWILVAILPLLLAPFLMVYYYIPKNL